MDLKPDDRSLPGCYLYMAGMYGGMHATEDLPGTIMPRLWEVF